MTSAEEHAAWQREVGLVKTTTTDEDPFDAERAAFLAAFRKFREAGLALVEVWDGESFHADEWAPLPARLTPPASLDDWLWDLSGHYDDARARDDHDAAEAARQDRECGVSVTTAGEDPYGTSCERTRGHDGEPHAGPDPFGSPGDSGVWVWTGGGSAAGDALPWSMVARLVARPEFGSFVDFDDPVPSGSVGRLHCPMNADGSPDLDNLGEIEVRYEDA